MCKIMGTSSTLKIIFPKKVNNIKTPLKLGEGILAFGRGKNDSLLKK